MRTAPLAVLATLLFTSTAALAERPPGPPGPPGEKREEIRARVEQKIQTFVTVELSSRLGLDQKRALQVSDAVKRHMERKHERRERLRTEGEKLKALVDKKASDAQLKAQLDTVVGLAGKDDDLHDFLADTSKFLNVTEQAKLALAMPDIMRDMHRMVRDARREGRGPGGPGGFGPPGDDE